MRFFVTKDLNKNFALKLIILFSLIFFIGLIVTNFLFMTKIGFTIQEIINYYLGNPETFRQPKSYGSIVEETHERLGKDKNYLLDSSNLREDFKWQPEITLYDGIQRTINWIDSNFEELSNLPWIYEHKI